MKGFLFQRINRTHWIYGNRRKGKTGFPCNKSALDTWAMCSHYFWERQDLLPWLPRTFHKRKSIPYTTFRSCNINEAKVQNKNLQLSSLILWSFNEFINYRLIITNFLLQCNCIKLVSVILLPLCVCLNTCMYVAVYQGTWECRWASENDMSIISQVSSTISSAMGPLNGMVLTNEVIWVVSEPSRYSSLCFLGAGF